MEIIYKLPKLYIISNNKKRFWEIWIEKSNDIYYICRIYGIIGSKITISNKKEINDIKKAKTKVNAEWRKKKESGFEENEIKSKLKTNVIKPMGAYKLEEHFNKIKYPCYVQRKLDGFRCISNIVSISTSDLIVKMYSKGMKEFSYLNHIKKEIIKIKELCNNSNIYLDGELYENKLRLHEISSLVMKKYASKEDEKNMEKISYYIFDIFNINNLKETFEERYIFLSNIFKKYKFKYLKLVSCEKVNSLDNIYKLNDNYLYEGYEGVIVRNMNGIYKLNSKSYDVLRTKEFKKKDFEIIGATESDGTHKGAILWNLQCLNNKKKSFWAIPIGTIKERIILYNNYIKNPSKYIGKIAKVKFLEITNEGCVSRNPIVENIYI
jgi:ATP-dependent DNA ligase